MKNFFFRSPQPQQQQQAPPYSQQGQSSSIPSQLPPQYYSQQQQMPPSYSQNTNFFDDNFPSQQQQLPPSYSTQSKANPAQEQMYKVSASLVRDRLAADDKTNIEILNSMDDSAIIVVRGAADQIENVCFFFGF